MARKIETSFTSTLSSVLEDNKNNKVMFSMFPNASQTFLTISCTSDRTGSVISKPTLADISRVATQATKKVQLQLELYIKKV